ncbi:hypothetical protein MJM59_30015, partial [Salmonella enterica subsp. enterica serovar Montevideo]|nr:hypothetical protein [Salmonella enterica subsp. enterica serovar Montevideo]
NSLSQFPDFHYTLRGFYWRRDGMQNRLQSGGRLGRQALLFPLSPKHGLLANRRRARLQKEPTCS